MSSFQSDFRSCTDRYENHMSVGLHKEQWNFDIGVKKGVKLDENGTSNKTIIQEVSEDALSHLTGGKKRAVQIIITGIDEKEVVPGHERRQMDEGKGEWPEGYHNTPEYRESVERDVAKMVKVRVIHYKLCIDGKVEEHHTNEARIKSSIVRETNNHRVLLERFSRYDKKEMGIFSRIKRALVDFFTKLFKPFESLSLLWEGLTERSEKKMKCDVSLLAEVTGSSGSTESLTMAQSLKYMTKLLRREKEGISDERLLSRLENAQTVAKKTKRLRKKFKKDDFAKLVKNIQADVNNLPVDGSHKLLIPVGYQQGDKLVEMFLEIKKTDEDTCTVALISRSEQTLDLFDSSEGVDTSSRSLRREIEGVKVADFQGRVPIFMELQTNPELQKVEGDRTRDIFLKQLHFEGSTVAVGKLTETSLTESSFGHVSEIMSYVKSELLETDQDVTDAQRFEVAARLRFFLDFCKKDNKWLRDPGQRDLVRTTAYQLIDMIEKNRQELIGDSHLEQGQELTKIVYELEQVLFKFDDILPSTPDLSTKTLSQAELGEIEVEAAEETPELENIPMIAAPYVEVDPPFAGFNEDKAVESIEKFAARCQLLMDAGEVERASYEAQIFVKTLPTPDSELWDEISDQGASIMKNFQTMGEAITKQSLKKPHSSLNEALTISMLNLHMLKIAKGNSPTHADALSALAFKARKNLTELLNSRISVQDKLRIEEFDHIMGERDIDEHNFDALYYSHARIPSEILKPLVNLSEYSAIAAGDLAYEEEDVLALGGFGGFGGFGGYGLGDQRTENKIDFEKTQEIRRKLGEVDSLEFSLNIIAEGSIKTACEGVPIWDRDVRKINSRISFTAPAYAENVAEEIANRYTTELCPFGCSRDNCENYGGMGYNPTPTPEIARKGHQFFPLYMLYHFTGEYCSKLIAEGKLRHDEVRDLLLLQQTNQSANTLFRSHHNEQGSRIENHFDYADGFTEDDRRIQVISSLNIYLKHPNFFKQPALRWLLETKLFNHNAFAQLLKDENYLEHKPFLISTIKQLNREVGLAHANQDLETASYLVHLLENLSDIISESDLDGDEIDLLTELISAKPEETIIQWMIDSAGQKSEKETKKQKTLLPYVLSHYLELYNKNPADPIFKEDKHLNLLAYAIARYESLHTPGDPVDPKLKESFQLIKHLMVPKIRERAKDVGGPDFINSVVDRFDPLIADKDLEWEEAEFPIYEARQDDRTYQFNLETGSIYAGGERVQLLPSFLKEQPHIVGLYGSNLQDVWQVKGAPDLEERVREDGTDHFRVTAYSHEKFSGQRIVIREPVDENGKDIDERPEVVIERKVLNQAGEEEWASYHRFESQDKLAKGESIKESDLPQKVAAAIGGRSCWISRELDRIYIFDHDEDKPYATLELTKQKKPEVSEALEEELSESVSEIEDEELGPLEISEFRFTDGGSLLLASDRDFIQYSSIESEAFILPIGSVGIVSRLEYPRLELASSGAKLSYTLTENGAVSSSFPGWSLAPLGTRPGNRRPADNIAPLPETFDHYQLLQKDGAQKVLIPARQFAQLHNSLGEPIPKYKAISPDGFQASTVFEFSVNPETNRLQAKSADAYAYLAYLSLTHQDYEGAKYYLDRADSSTGYSPRYKEVFDWVQKWPDNSPNGQALKLHTAIFQDRISDEYKIEQIRTGEKEPEFEQPKERVDRLAQLAKLYHNYRQSLDSREIGLKGSDTRLDLDPEDELRALKLTREFVKHNGDVIVYQSRVEATEFKRAKTLGGSILIAEPSGDKFLEDDNDALLIWATIGSSSKIPDVTFGHPEWVLDCFGHVFDQLITLDPESAEFKQLVQKIRFISENPYPPRGLSISANSAIKQAQGYLLRLAELAKNDELDKIKEMLEESKDKFPKVRGSASTRVQRFESTHLEDLKEIYEYKNPEEALEGIHKALEDAEKELAEIMTEIDEDVERAYFVKAATKAAIKKQFQPGIDRLNKLSSFCEKFQAQVNKIEQKNETLTSDKKIALPSFQEEYRQFIKNTLYGSGSPQTIEQIGNVFALLKDVEVSDAEAFMKEREPSEVAAEEVEKTAEEVYGKLFTDPPEELRETVNDILWGEETFRNRLEEQVDQIEDLEHLIKKTSAPIDDQKIETSEMGKHTVLGDDHISDYGKYYRISSKAPEIISEDVFDKLARSDEKAVKRLAEVHRKDMQAYEEDNITVDITRGGAKKLRAHLVSQREELEFQKNDSSRLLLQAVERFNTPAGILVMRRLTGKTSKPNIDYLVNLWRRGEITKQPWEANPLKDLGISKITESELAELDLWITSYMDASTALQHMDRVIHSVDAYIESCGSKSSSSGDMQLAQTLVQGLETKRNYNYFVTSRELTVPDLALALRNPEVKHELENRLDEKKSRLARELQRIDDPVKHQETIIDLFENPTFNLLLNQILKEDKGLKNLIFSKGSDPDFRDLLFMEQREGIILRSAQVSTIRDMIHDPNAARQLIMGAGKSKVLSPLLALKKANGTNLVMLMLPEALYETNCRDLDATNRELFGQPIFRFEFNRQSDRSVEALQETYIQLLECVKNKGFVPTTKSSMLSFRNAYFELLNLLSEIPPEQLGIQRDKVEDLTDQIRIMSKILNLFATRTDVLADEIDACLDVRKEVNFALGDPQRINPIIHETGSELMEIILSAEEGTDLAELQSALINNTSASIPPERLHELLEELGRSFYNENKGLAGISEDDFINYLFDDDSLDGELPDFMTNMKAEAPELYKKVAAAKAFLHRGYGSTLTRISNVNYGRDPESRIWTIPYKASMAPSLGSEFDDTIERICFTLQDYVLNGVSYEQVYKVIADLHNAAIEELRTADVDKVINIDETESGKLFKKLIKELDPNKDLGPSPSLAAFASEEKVTQLTNIINKTAIGKMTFARRYVLPEITQAPSRVNSVSDDAPAMVKHFSGFTGTPWNLHTYNDKIHAERSPGTDGRTWALLLKRDVKVKTFAYDPKKPIESLIDGAGIVSGHYQATVDTGAYLRGQTNADYVTACLRKAEAEGLEGQSGVYFDESGKIVKKAGSKGKPLPIEVAAQGDLMECHTLYDQAHTVGADIKQGRKAKAIVTVGEATFIRDLFQAVWRLRQLHEEQDIEIAVSDEVKKLILGDSPDRDLKIDDILAFCLTNEARRESEDNLRAEKGKIQGKPNQVMLSECAKAFATEETSTEDIHKIAYSLGTAFTKRRPQDEIFDEYAEVRTSEDPATILAATRKRTKARAKQMAEVLYDIAGWYDDDPANLLAERLRETAKEVKNRKDPPSDWMPDEVDSSAMEAGQQVEVEAQAQVEVAQMVQVDAEVDAEVAVQAEKVVAAGKPVSAGSGGEINPLTARAMREVTLGSRYIPGEIRQVSRTIGAFDPNIYVSSGVERQMIPSEYADEWGDQDSLNFNRVAKTIFYTYRKAVNDVVIVKGPEGWKMFIPTIHEAQAGCRQFIREADKLGMQAVQVNIGTAKPNIVFKTGDDRTDALPFTSDEDRRQFYRLYVQAKFFNGEINYGSKDEREALKDWLGEKGPEACKYLFESQILPTKPIKYNDDYPESNLYKVFEELGA